MTNEELEAQHMERNLRFDRAKGTDGFKLAQEVAEEMAMDILLQARDEPGLTAEHRIELLNKSDALSYFVRYLDECVGRAEEELAKLREKEGE